MPGTGDPLKLVSPGEDFVPSADAWNAFIECARRLREGGKGSPYVPRTCPWDPVMVRVRASSAFSKGGVPLDTVPIFSIVSLRGPVLIPAIDEYMPIFEIASPGYSTGGVGPNDPQQETIGVLMEPVSISDDFGGLGWAMISGVAQVFVDAIPGGHYPYTGAWYDAKAGEHRFLSSNPQGRFRFIYEPLVPFTDPDDSDRGVRAWVHLGLQKVVPSPAVPAKVRQDQNYQQVGTPYDYTDLGTSTTGGAQFQNVFLASLGTDGTSRLARVGYPNVTGDDAGNNRQIIVAKQGVEGGSGDAANSMFEWMDDTAAGLTVDRVIGGLTFHFVCGRLVSVTS